MQIGQLNHLLEGDPGFPRGGGANSPGGRQHTILPYFPENCMKLKEFGPRGGGARPSRSPLRSATGKYFQVMALSPILCALTKTESQIMCLNRRRVNVPLVTKTSVVHVQVAREHKKRSDDHYFKHCIMKMRLDI